jgi:type I restriction enzyme S subunit
LKPFENPTYLQYLLYSYDTKKIFYGMGGGVRQSIGYKEIRNMFVPLPLRPEQDQIVRFLDWKVSMIDKYISAKKKQIALLQEQKQTIINQAVTKGLNPNAPMKDSGIEWIGKVPESWEITKLRNILSPVSIKNRPDFELLSVTREDGVIKRNYDKEINHNYIPDDLSSYKVVERGQFVINKMKAWQGSYGISEYRGIVSPAYFVFDVSYANKKFFELALRSKTYINFFVQASDGIRIGQWDLSMQKLKGIPFLIPTKNEQSEIIEYIQNRTKENKLIIDKFKNEIGFLSEYRIRLISDVITGKVDVRNVKAPDFEMEAIKNSENEENMPEYKYGG